MLVIAGVPSWAWAAPTDLVIVASQDFPADALTLEELQNVYLGKKRSVNGVPVVAIDQSEVEPIKDQFLARVFKVTRFEYRAQLLKRRFQEGAVVPTFAANSPAVLNAVAKTEGAAIGYVYRSEAALYPELKILLVVPAN